MSKLSHQVQLKAPPTGLYQELTAPSKFVDACTSRLNGTSGFAPRRGSQTGTCVNSQVGRRRCFSAASLVPACDSADQLSKGLQMAKVKEQLAVKAAEQTGSDRTGRIDPASGTDGWHLHRGTCTSTERAEGGASPHTAGCKDTSSQAKMSPP